MLAVVFRLGQVVERAGQSYFTGLGPSVTHFSPGCSSNLTSQLGKPYTLRDDEIVRRTRDWIHEPFSQPNDVLVCTLLDIQRHASDIVDILCWSDMPLNSSGLLANFNYNFVLQPAQENMVRIWEYWKPLLE